MTLNPDAPRLRVQLGDILALIASIAIVVGYAALPLSTIFAPGASGGAFTDQRTTFLVLTFVVGVVGIISVIVNIVGPRDRGIRWWYLGLGLLSLVFFVDNTLLSTRFLDSRTARSVGIWKITLDTGGLVMFAGSILLVLQTALPRRGEQKESTPRDRTNDTILGLIRVVIATLWITQLLWKLPWNNYGCVDALVPAAGTSGLCDWVGREVREPRYDMYLSFLQSFVSPNLSWMAFFILAGEAFIGFSLLLGLFTRIGALAGLLMGINLFVGLTAVRNPFEWDWTYLMLPALNAVFIAVGGQWVGLDALIHPRLKNMVDQKQGGIIARLFAWVTR